MSTAKAHYRGAHAPYFVTVIVTIIALATVGVASAGCISYRRRCTEDSLLLREKCLSQVSMRTIIKL